jgi:hypothetical protein
MLVRRVAGTCAAFPLLSTAAIHLCSLDDRRVRTRVAALCSARYFLTSLGSTDALGNQILVRAVTSYSNPDSLTIWWTSCSWSPRGDRSPCALPGICAPFSATAAAGDGLFSADSDGRGEDRARLEAGEPLPSVPPSSSAKTSKTQSLPRPSARPDPLGLRLRLPRGLALKYSCADGWSCLS